MLDAKNKFRSFSLFSVLSALFILSLFYRVSNAVIAPNLMWDLGLDAEAMGILGGAYFYSFALLQIPMGLMLDRIGPRIVVAILALIGGLGAFLFASGESFGSAFAGRIMIGAGMASVLMGSLKIFVLRFSPEKFASLMGTLVSIGTLGSILATSPLVYLSSTIGWRTTFMIAAGITMLLGLLVFWVLGEREEVEKRTFSSLSSGREAGVLRSTKLILRSLTFWQIGAVAFFRYGTFIGLQGLWLGPYLMDSKGYSPILTGNILMLLAVGTIIGAPIAGRLSDRTFHSRKSVALCGLSLYGVSIFPLTGVLNIQSPLLYALIFFFMGFFHGFGNLIYSHAKELFPADISGTVMAWVNFFTVAGAAIFTPFLGKVIATFPSVDHSYPAEAYHLSFLICFLGMVASLIFYFFSEKERYI